MIERVLQHKTIELAKKAGIMAIPIEGRGRQGVPDLLMVGHGTVELWELKIKGGRLRPQQKLLIPKLREAGAVVRIVVGIDEARKLIDEWISET